MALSGPAAALAQTYYSTTPFSTYSGSYNSTSSCVVLSRNLSFGSRDAYTGNEVSTLQRFLVSQNYPGGGSWMITGYFGNATAQAVRNFQVQNGIPATGVADAQTRLAIQQRTCGGYAHNPHNPGYGYYPQDPYYNYHNQVRITSLSTYVAQPGTRVTIYGSGFDSYSNTVRLGSTVVGASGTGSTLTFSVPYLNEGTYQLSVSNTRGTSNQMTLTIRSQYGSGCTYPYAYNCNPGTLSINSLLPNAGSVGASVTIYGSGFSREGNTVHFGNGIIVNQRSHDGSTISFTVPFDLVGYGNEQVRLGTYNVYVTNQVGQHSNSLPFTVTSLGNYGTRPTITNVTGPHTLAVGSSGTWRIVVNAQANTPVTVGVTWGDEYLHGAASQTAQTYYLPTGQQTLTFTHAYQHAGTYTPTFTVQNTAGSNTATASVMVTGSSNTNELRLHSLSHTAGQRGTQITLHGSGFDSYNTVHFGIGGMQGIASSNNGTRILFTIPHYVSPCHVITQPCGAPVTVVEVGQSYPIYVTNSRGSTQALYFTVTN